MRPVRQAGSVHRKLVRSRRRLNHGKATPRRIGLFARPPSLTLSFGFHALPARVSFCRLLKLQIRCLCPAGCARSAAACDRCPVSPKRENALSPASCAILPRKGRRRLPRSSGPGYPPVDPSAPIAARRLRQAASASPRLAGGHQYDTAGPPVGEAKPLIRASRLFGKPGFRQPFCGWQ